MGERRAAAAGVARPFAELCADERAFTAWYEAALPRVYGFVYARAGADAWLAEDVTAQAFHEGVRARHSFDGRSDLVTWICSIARNRLIDHYRRQNRERMRNLRLIVGDITTESESLGAVENRDAVLSMLAALPDAERIVLTLRYLDGYSVGEIATLVGRTTPATESLLARARERVRTAFPGGMA